MDDNPNDNFSLASVFSQSYFEVPDYQRNYAWDRANVSDMLGDLIFTYEQNEIGDTKEDLPHYFGTLVLEKRGTTEPKDFQQLDVLGIVDGQQRLTTFSIIISAIVEEMQAIANEDSISDEQAATIMEQSVDVREDYVAYENRNRIQLGGLGADAYDSMIIDGCSPEDYLQEHDCIETERKIAKAKKFVQSQLNQWKIERFQNGDTDTNDYFSFLKTLVKVLSNAFEVNIRVVEGMDEASRLFKVINMRGRGLKKHDMVRTHLVYCASKSDGINSEHIFRIFNSVVENITIHDGFSDDEVDAFLELHWKVFAGEASQDKSNRAGPDDMHKRIAEMDYYANIQRDNYEIFINEYLNSLQNFSELYPYLTDPDNFASKYSEQAGENTETDLNATVKKIQLLYSYSRVRRAVTPLLTTMALKYGVDSEQFANTVGELEKLALRHSFIMSNSVTTYQTGLGTAANDLYWADESDAEIETIFNSDKAMFKGHKISELSVRNILSHIRETREDHAPIQEVINEYLKNNDVLHGDFTSGWGGVRNREVIKYILYEYERSLREDTGEQSLAPYHEFREEFEVEHIVAENVRRGNELKNHKENQHRLGNLALLSSHDNKSENNKPYQEKFNGIYTDSSLNQLRELPDPPFTVDDIRYREEEQLIPFIVNRWGSNQSKLTKRFGSESAK